MTFLDKLDGETKGDLIQKLTDIEKKRWSGRGPRSRSGAEVTKISLLAREPPQRCCPYLEFAVKHNIDEFSAHVGSFDNKKGAKWRAETCSRAHSKSGPDPGGYKHRAKTKAFLPPSPNQSKEVQVPTYRNKLLCSRHRNNPPSASIYATQLESSQRLLEHPQSSSSRVGTLQPKKS